MANPVYNISHLIIWQYLKVLPEDPEECVDSPGEGFMSTEPS